MAKMEKVGKNGTS